MKTSVHFDHISLISS